MGWSLLLIIEVVLFFLAAVAAYLSVTAEMAWRVVRDLLLVVGVTFAALFFLYGTLLCFELRSAFISSGVVFLVGSVTLRLLAYRSSRQQPDCPRALLWRRPILCVGLPVTCGLCFTTAIFIQWRAREALRAGIQQAEAMGLAVPPPGSQNAAPLYREIWQQFWQDGRVPEVTLAVLSRPTPSSRLDNLDLLEVEERETLLEEVREFFHRHRDDLAALRDATRYPEHHLASADLDPERFLIESGSEELPPFWACHMVLRYHIEQAKRDGDSEAVLASGRALQGLTDQIVMTAPVTILGFLQAIAGPYGDDLTEAFATQAKSPEGLSEWVTLGELSYLDALPRILWNEEAEWLRSLQEEAQATLMYGFVQRLFFPGAQYGTQAVLQEGREVLRRGYRESLAVYSRWSSSREEAFFGYTRDLVGGFLASAARAHTRRRLRRVGVALYRFHSAEGRFPEALDELVPEYLDAVPEDPYTGGPLRYSHQDGGCAVSSVGPLDGDSTDFTFRCTP